jgi:hypothetical protein
MTFVFLRLMRSRLTLCQYPETATFLSEDERQFVIQTRREDSLGQATHFSAKFIWQALADWKTYVQILNYIGCVVMTITH